MPPAMYAAFVFAIAVLIPVYLTTVRANGIGGTDFVTSLRGLGDSHVWNQDFDPGDLNDTGVEVRQHAGCSCENGKCVRDGNRELCVCDPQFALVGDSECKYCNCGIGFNCTFTRKNWVYPRISKDCHCPDGYEEKNGRCREECSPWKRCQNGGTCSSGVCECKSGTLGDFCETIEGCSTNCRPRKMVECQYSHLDETYVCLCKNRSLVYDYSERLCKPCPCGDHGRCVYVRRTLQCECDQGFQEHNGYCKLCDCGPGSYSCSLRYSGEKTCSCEKGYVEREGYCVECGCGSKSTDCSLENGVKKCVCLPGFEDSFGFCEDIDECKLNDTCHPTAKCVNTEGSYRCECEAGYKTRYGGIEDGCEDLDECKIKIRPCKWNSAQCANLPGTYKCVCEVGYQPVDMTVDPADTECEEYQESWLPSILTFCTAAFVILTVLIADKCVEHRRRNRN